MKRSILLAILPFLLFICSCASVKLVDCPSDKLSELKSSEIYLSTDNKIKVMNNWTRETEIVRFEKEKVFTYKFTNDSLIISAPKYTGKIPLSQLSNIKYSGVFDTELGIVYEKDLLKYMDNSYRVKNRLLYGILGGAIPIIVAAALISNSNTFDELGVGLSIGIFGTIIGTAAGIIFGDHKGINDDVNAAVENMKEH